MGAACDDRETKRAGTCWSATFADDLLALVYSMIVSPLDHARFAAVCRSWRAAARGTPPVPTLPWLLLSPLGGRRTKALHYLEDGALVRLRVPRRWIIGGHDGGWVALRVPGLFRIVNLFSGAEVALKKKKATIICAHHGPSSQVDISRVIFSELPNTRQCILAALMHNCGITLCRVACPNSGWTIHGCPHSRQLLGISFCNGTLYGLCYKTSIIKFEIGMNEDCAPLVTAEHQLLMERIDRTIGTSDYRKSTSYIFDLECKLAMALKTRWLPNIQPFFKVFKLIDTHTSKQKELYMHKWQEVTSLGDHSLFLGDIFSKAVHVPMNVSGGVERNRIYYSHHCWFGQHTIVPSDMISVTILNNYRGVTCYKEVNSKNGITGDDVKRIMSVGYIMNGRSHGGMWILPPDI